MEYDFIKIAERIATDFRHLNMAIEKVIADGEAFTAAEKAAPLLLEVRGARDLLDRTMEMLSSHYKVLQQVHVPNTFERQKVENIRMDGYRFSVTHNWRASYKEGMKPEALVWLRSNELGDIIQDYVPPMTLAATAKSLNEENQSLPDDLFTTFIQNGMSITKVVKAK